LEKAAELMKQDYGNISEICYSIGFKEQTYFTTTFKKHFGTTPSEYRHKLI